MSKENPHNITLVTVCKNIIENKKEEIFLKTLKAARKLSNKILLVDNNSTDGSLKLYKKYFEKLDFDFEIKVDKRTEFNYLKYEYSNTVKEGYVLILDDDEIFSDKLIGEITETLTTSKPTLFIFPWNTYILNKPVVFSSKPILFKAEYNIMLPSYLVHEQFDYKKIKNLPKKEIKKCKGEVYHDSYSSLSDLYRKTSFYAKDDGLKAYQNNPNMGGLRVLCNFLYYSAKYFFGLLYMQKGRFSLPGFFFAFNATSYRFQQFFYYLELQEKNKKNKTK